MTTELSNLLETAQMSPVMVVEQCEDYTSKLGLAAYHAIAKAERQASPMANAQARAAAVAWIDANEDAARRIIQRRIDIQRARDNRPPSAAVARALRGED